MSKLTRRAALGALGATAAATAMQFGGVKRARAQSPTLKIGYLAPLSGSQEIIGKAQLLGAQIAVDQINAEGGVLGKTLELVVRDDKSNAAAGATVVRELAGDGINLLAGSFSSPVALALLPVLQSENLLFVTQAQALPSLTHESFVRNLFRPNDYSYIRLSAAARLMAEQYPDTNSWTAINADIATAVATWDSFTNGLYQYYPELAQKDVSIVEPVKAPFGSPDYRDAINTLSRVQAKGFFIGVYGGDTITFLRQAKPYDLMKQFSVIADAGSEFFVPQTLKKDTPDGMWTGHHWYYGAYENNPVSVALYNEIVKRSGEKHPQGFTGEAHTAIRAIASGVARAQATDTESVIAAMEGMSFDTCKNRRTFRKEDHQADADINFVSFAPDDTEQGWKVKDYKIVKAVDVMPPPAPGKPLALPFLEKHK